LGGAPLLFLSSGVVFLIVFAFWIWALLDVIATDSEACRNLPKVAWLIVVFLLADIGAVAWILFGRPPKGRWMARSTDFATPRRPVGFEDRPDYAERPEITDRRSAELDLRLEAWEAEQRERRGDTEPRERGSDE
jgi:Phospholipase_D-nuclease N-terminal